MFFDYELPEGLIAQHPAERRDEARMLVVHCKSGELEHRRVRDLPEYLQSGDVLVFNDTKVLPARLTGMRQSTGGKWESLFLREVHGEWEMLAQTRGSPRSGERFETATGFVLELMARTPDGHWLMKPLAEGTPERLLQNHGSIPLPPYIRDGTASVNDVERYQTVFARTPGSVAAPTAGLHFTTELLAAIGAKGVSTAKVTLHVGLGTFAPIKEANPLDHVIHAEWCEVTQETVDAIHSASRVFAVGTTTSRTLESAAREGELKPYHGETNLAIYPPYEFKVVNNLLTNFHLPKTTLLLLVQSLCGSELMKRAYEEAIRERYRFYSYGDAMLILK